jgi:hypothetical protein
LLSLSPLHEVKIRLSHSYVAKYCPYVMSRTSVVPVPRKSVDTPWLRATDIAQWTELRYNFRSPACAPPDGTPFFALRVWICTCTFA